MKCVSVEFASFSGRMVVEAAHHNMAVIKYSVEEVKVTNWKQDK